MVKIENYVFSKKTTTGKYRTYLDDFLKSKEPSIAWQCADLKEVKACTQGFNKLIRDRRLRDVVRVRSSYIDRVVGLERVTHE